MQAPQATHTSLSALAHLFPLILILLTFFPVAAPENKKRDEPGLYSTKTFVMPRRPATHKPGARYRSVFGGYCHRSSLL